MRFPDKKHAMVLEACDITFVFSYFYNYYIYNMALLNDVLSVVLDYSLFGPGPFPFSGL
jgi:hypothetical protein